MNKRTNSDKYKIKCLIFLYTVDPQKGSFATTKNCLSPLLRFWIFVKDFSVQHRFDLLEDIQIKSTCDEVFIKNRPILIYTIYILMCRSKLYAESDSTLIQPISFRETIIWKQNKSFLKAELFIEKNRRQFWDTVPMRLGKKK